MLLEADGLVEKVEGRLGAKLCSLHVKSDFALKGKLDYTTTIKWLLSSPSTTSSITTPSTKNHASRNNAGGKDPVDESYCFWQ